jgi:MarR family transcriptional regulator, transcriptional regulator for hemolysin
VARPAKGSDAASRLAQYKAGDPPPEMKLTIKLVLAARLWRARVDERLRPIQYSSSRMETLGAIAASPADSTQTDVARRLRIEGPSLTRMVQLLEKEHLIGRKTDPADARSKLLSLTDKGEGALEEIFALSDAMRLALLDGIDPAMLATVEAFLDEIIRRLDETVDQGTGE